MDDYICRTIQYNVLPVQQILHNILQVQFSQQL